MHPIPSPIPSPHLPYLTALPQPGCLLLTVVSVPEALGWSPPKPPAGAKPSSVPLHGAGAGCWPAQAALPRWNPGTAIHDVPSGSCPLSAPPARRSEVGGPVEVSKMEGGHSPRSLLSLRSVTKIKAIVVRAQGWVTSPFPRTARSQGVLLFWFLCRQDARFMYPTQYS